MIYRMVIFQFVILVYWRVTIKTIGLLHGSLNVPIEHHPTKIGIWYMVNAMATFSGDVQYSQNGTVTNPCCMVWYGLVWYGIPSGYD